MYQEFHAFLKSMILTGKFLDWATAIEKENAYITISQEWLIKTETRLLISILIKKANVT